MQLSFAALAPGLADHCLGEHQSAAHARAGSGVAVQDLRTRDELRNDAGKGGESAAGGHCWQVPDTKEKKS